jgi:hypothetical protein
MLVRNLHLKEKLDIKYKSEDMVNNHYHRDVRQHCLTSKIRFLPLVTLAPVLAVIIVSMFIDGQFHLVYGQSNNNNNSNGAYLTYNNTAAGFIVKYPSDWKELQPHYSDEGVKLAFLSPVTKSGFTTSNIASGPLINTSISGIPLPISLQEDTREEMYNLKKYDPTINFTESSSTLLGGIPANKIVFVSSPTTGITKGIQEKSMMIITIKDGREFILGFGGPKAFFDQYSPTMQKIIESFSFLPSTSSRSGG